MNCNLQQNEIRLYFHRIYPLLLLFILYFYTACEEPYEMDMGIPEDAIIFDGVITNEPPPYFFSLSKPSANLKKNETCDYERINDAEIVIVDLTDGTRDTLEIAEVNLYDDFQYYDHYNHKKVTYYIRWKENQKPGGLYVTTKIYGIENHIYELHIKYKGKEYVACERMVPKTPIDKIIMKRVDIGEGEHNEAPCISFRNPPEEHNYYLYSIRPFSSKTARIASIEHLYGEIGNTGSWSFSILDDQYLVENVENYELSAGEQFILPGRPSWSYPMSDSVWVQMHSITENCYNVFDQMIKQFRSDGGTFSPRPASVRSNISNGAYGIFRVSAISEIYYYKKHRI